MTVNVGEIVTFKLLNGYREEEENDCVVAWKLLVSRTCPELQHRGSLEANLASKMCG